LEDYPFFASTMGSAMSPWKLQTAIEPKARAAPIIGKLWHYPDFDKDVYQ
jgi:hypothetical protein